jgi:hypothetical protein
LETVSKHSNLKISIMKKILYISALSLLLFSCEQDKDNVTVETNANNEKITVITETARSNSQEEVARIINDAEDPTHTIAIIDNPNFGVISESNAHQVVFGGSLPNGVSIAIDGKEYANGNERGSILKQGGQYRSFFGREVEVAINAGKVVKRSTIYIPKPALVTKLGEQQSLEIPRTGNELTWEPDKASTTGKVALYYELYDSNIIGDQNGKYKTDIILLDDTGRYSLDEIINDGRCQKIYFRLVTGNTTSLTLDNKQKILFHISSYDHHEYLIK